MLLQTCESGGSVKDFSVSASAITFFGMLGMNLHSEKFGNSIQILIKHFNNILLVKVTLIILVVSALVLKGKVKYVAAS